MSLFYQDKVIVLLKDVSKHKIFKLQKAGAEALKQWDLLSHRESANDGVDASDKILLPEEEEAEKVAIEHKRRPSVEKSGHTSTIRS